MSLGMTVLMRALNTSPLTQEVFDEVKYLIKERGANPALQDKCGRNAVSSAFVYHEIMQQPCPFTP